MRQVHIRRYRKKSPHSSKFGIAAGNQSSLLPASTGPDLAGQWQRLSSVAVVICTGHSSRSRPDTMGIKLLSVRRSHGRRASVTDAECWQVQYRSGIPCGRTPFGQRSRSHQSRHAMFAERVPVDKLSSRALRATLSGTPAACVRLVAIRQE